jgi:hypothetical protein
MSKIQTIRIENFKAISDLEMDFKGATAIITGANNSGKTSFLRGIPDRIRFVRPDVMVKAGEKEGKGEMTLTTGERFIWEFSDGVKDKLTYITKEGLKQGVTMELGKQFFPPIFDIDKFLQSTPKSQAKQLQAIIGLDFDDIDKRYAEAYALRTERNREAELYRVKLEKLIKCDRVDPVDLTNLLSKKEAEKKKLNDLYLQNKKHNEDLRKKWNAERVIIDKEVDDFNNNNSKLSAEFKQAQEALNILVKLGYRGEDALLFVESLEVKIMDYKIADDLFPKEPTYIDEMPDRKSLDEIDQQILANNEINLAAQKYKEYIDHKTATENARDAADDANELVLSIENERLKLIESAKMPKGISITSEGILVDGLPLDKNQISTSKLYCSALRIASLNIGEVRTLYFDASFLDRNSLAEIQTWANENDLQLLIERPDYDAGEITYQLIETIC